MNQAHSTTLLATEPNVRSRARALGKGALYVLIAFIGALATSAALRAAAGRTLQELMAAGSAEGLLAHVGLLLAVAVIPTLVPLRLWNEPLATAGWSRPVGDGSSA